MATEIRVPEVGESVQEALLAEWFVDDGSAVKKDEALFLLETDKVTLEVPAEASGVVRIDVRAGATVKVGDVVGTIAAEAGAEEPRAEKAAKAPETAEQAPPEEKPAPRRAASTEQSAAAVGSGELTPSVRRLVEEEGLDPSRISATGPGGRLTRGDVLLHLEARGQPAEPSGEGKGPVAESERPRAGKTGVAPAPSPEPQEEARPGEEKTTRKPLSPIRKRIAERLLEAKRSTAMLTTFNEVDMGAVMDLRTRHKSAFRAKYGVGLGITSFFVKAACQALYAFPQVNAFIEGDEIVYHEYVHMGVAIGAERGLVVPVLRHADQMGTAAIERGIADFADRVKENRLELSDLEGGTFTITNGGVFGSLLSTPILNPPQSAILGLHKVEDRPVAVDRQVVVRPMMYVALSYDHRIIDGRDAVQFLVRVKELVEEPVRLWLEV
jgi:2-oxoglutarate dehydrogenase E2 component (dihydrolipoamide succinyltransferase)